MHHSSWNTNDHSVLPLCDPILLWVMRHYEFSLNSFFATELFEFIGDIFTTIIAPYSLHLLPRLLLHQCFKLTELWECFALLLHEEDPASMRIDINKYNIITVFCCWINRERSTHICVNSLQDHWSTVLLLMKGGLQKLTHSASLALIWLRKSTLGKSSRNLLQNLQSAMVKMAQSLVP